jgi:Tol biopolymer transport system component
MTGHGLRRSAILFLLLALALSSRMGAQSGHELFQQALSKERAEGQLQEAIALYQRVVEVAGADHALAAKALLQLGRCYEALGNTKARTAYERLIARYPDQTDMVAQARSRLASMARTPAPAAPAAMTVRPLPELSAATPLLALSPDGTSAIVMDFSKGQNLALYEFAKRRTRLLTDLDWLMGYTLFAAWSPDARRVAYLYVNLKAESELRVMTLDGRSNVVYRAEGVPAVQPVGWTPDGATLVVVMARPDKTWALGTLPATGGPFTPLRSLGWSYDWRDGSPRLSPDGRLIAYLEGERGLRDVHVLTLDGRDAYRVTDDPADDLAPIWSPDGRHLVFTSNRQSTVSLWAVELEEGKPVGPPVKLKDGMQSARLIDWTARGIFYDQQTTTRDLFTVAMDPIEGRATGSPRQIPYSRTGRNVSPVWSPDGGRLAFVSSANTEPNRRYVVVMPADGGQAREFLIPTTTWEYTQSPYDLRWFGDGRGLGFSGTDTRGVPAVFRLRLETGEWDTIPMAMVDAEFGMRTEWNRDGSAFYFARRMPANAGIFERAVNGDAERLIYRSTPSMFRSLEFSPDRKWLAFQQRTTEANYRGKSRVLIVDIETGETRTVLEEGSSLNDRWPLNLVGWTPSGSLLVERFGTGGAAPEALLAPVNGGAPRSFAVPSFGSTGTREPQPDLVAKWSPDGRSMVLVRVSRGGEAFVIEHPLAGVRATTVGR